jgi:hypothetical protein
MIPSCSEKVLKCELVYTMRGATWGAWGGSQPPRRGMAAPLSGKVLIFCRGNLQMGYDILSFYGVLPINNLKKFAPSAQFFTYFCHLTPYIYVYVRDIEFSDVRKTAILPTTPS